MVGEVFRRQTESTADLSYDETVRKIVPKPTAHTGQHGREKTFDIVRYVVIDAGR